MRASGRALITTLFVVVCGLWSGCRAGDAKPAARTPIGPASLSETLQGYERFYEGDGEAAAACFDEAVRKNPSEAAALYAQAVQAASFNDYQKSMVLLSRAAVAAENSAWAEYYLEEIGSLLPYCHDLKPFLDAVDRVLQSPAALATIKDRARAALGESFAQRGDIAAAAQARRPLQHVTRWLLAGPFDNRDKAGFAAAYEPEKAIDLDKAMAGRNRQVKWFQFAVSSYDGRMSLAEIFEPRTHVLAYALTFVKADEAGWRVVRAGCAGACGIWVNEEPAGKIEQYNDFGDDKLAVPVYLHKGWNQVLVKSAIVQNTEWGFSLRFCNPAGGAAAGLTVEASAEGLAGYVAAKKERPAPGAKPERFALGLLEELEEPLKKQPDDPALLIAAGELQDRRNCGEKENQPGAKLLARAVSQVPRCPYPRLMLAAATDDSNEARQAAEAAYAAHPELPATLEALAVLADETQNYLIAADYARQLRAKFGAERMGRSALVLADGLSGHRSRPRRNRRAAAAPRGGGEGTGGGYNLRAEAYRLLRPFVEQHPQLADGWERLAEVEPSRQVRRATLQQALSYCGGNQTLRQLWDDELVAMGRDAEAAEHAAAGLAWQPQSVSAAAAAAKLFERAGDVARATQLLDEARRWAPENPELLEALAQARHQAGKTAEAVALFRDILAIRPNSPHVKDYLAVLDTNAGAERASFAPYDIALKDLAIPPLSAYPNDNSVNILTQEVVRVNDNGTSSRMVHRVAKLLRPAGLHDLSRHAIYYEPGRQVVDILRASVITPDGRELSRADVQDTSTSAAMGVQTKIYDEYFQKQVTFKDVEPGALIDLQYTIRDTGGNIYGDYFASLFYLNDDQPTVRCQYVLEYPKSLYIQTKVFNANVQPQRIEQPDAKREVLKWDLNNTPGVAVERAMPPVVDQLALLQVTTMRSWQDVGTWYWHLAQDQLDCTPEMRETIQAITRDCTTPREKLRAVHDWVIRNIRYLGIEFGRNGYRPHKAGETRKALYGDCKDTAMLIVAMLKEVGIPGRLVLIRTVNAGAVPPDSLPLPNLFNHCIAYVPQVDGKDYWVDGTTDFNRLDEVPWADQRAQVLVVDAAGGTFMRIPADKPQDNRVEQRFSVKVERGGGATILLHDVRHGQWAPGYRELAETPGRYERYMQDYAAKRFNGAELEKLELAPASEQGPMWMKTQLKVPALAAQSGERKALPATLDALNLSARYAGETKRAYDLELYFPWERKTEIAYELDKGLKIASVPEDAEIVEPFGSYRRTFRRKDETLTLQEEFVFTRQRVSVSEYEAFKGFCNRVDSLMDQKILLDAK